MKPPISAPFGSPSTEEQNQQIFRVDFGRSFAGYFLIYFLILTPILLPVMAPIRGNNELFIFCGIIVFAALVSTTVGLFFPVKISPNGLRGSNFWGVKREVEWRKIKRARFSWFIFSYAILSTSQKRNFIWLPLCLSDPKGFTRAIENLAPADNPLRLFLEKRGSK
ncbi:hypothetical protein B1R32_109120 [Abditibacterium utsteinense]|uniref:Uncharacterized protein n=1 Tax=Abditibacterium utsteinense TaxID=1960156 RepID=A0A2S8SSJ9_9BACT|nr:hypothetical protein [Abditibacterium utsteinense]PQV63780.1 hypothetical protein B1R32_109120 [Abditibacterium utsteinense]